MDKQISIIIPTYNMEKYIGRCLDSLLIPELDQVEVFVVNDGSKDRSSEIAHSYADRYPDSIRVIDKANGNYGSCINAALPQATGRYVKILDADDSFDTKAFSNLIKKLSKTEADVVITKTMRVDESDREIGLLKCPDFDIQDNKGFDIIWAEPYLKGTYIPMHCIAYSRDVFTRLAYRQTEGISYTDTQWASIPMAYCKTFIRYDIIVYRYLCGRDGQTMSPAQIKKSAMQYYKLTNDFLDFYENSNESIPDKSIFESLLDNNISGIYRQLLNNISPEAINVIKQIDKRLKQSFPWLYASIGEITFSKEVKYHMVKKLRRKQYSPDYHIPLHIYLRHVLLFKCKHLLGLK